MADNAMQSLFSGRSIRVMERSKGFYWRHTSENRLHGPFATLPEVLDDVDLRTSKRLAAAIDAEEATDADESVFDLIGVADWIDQETGRPNEDNISRLNLH